MLYEILYTRDSKGKIRTWRMEQDNDKHRTIAGIKDGNLVTSKWTVAKGKNVGKKNETSPTDQATIEINNKYTKQLKTGYHKNIEDVDTITYIPPMRAKLYSSYADKLDLSSGNYIVQCKLNGMRCVASKRGLHTREGEEYVAVPHIWNSLKPFFDKFPHIVLDGELFNEDLRQQLNEISKLIRKTKHITDEDLRRSEELVRFHVYDGFGFNHELEQNAPYVKRKEHLDFIIDRFQGNVIPNHYLMHVEDYPVKSEKELMEVYNSFLAEGHEGAILRDITKGYEMKKTKNILKIKPEFDDEAKILEIHEGEGNWQGTAKTATLEWNGKVFDATFKGTFQEQSEVLKEKDKFIGQIITFVYNDLTGLGTPNFARIDLKNCFKGDR